MLFNNFSDYGSGDSFDLSPRGSQEMFQAHYEQQQTPRERSISLLNLTTSKLSLNEVMNEFRLNGLDSPYNPDEERKLVMKPRPAENLVGMGPSGTYLRQKSWPEPDRTPVLRLPAVAATSTPEWDPPPVITPLSSQQLQVQDPNTYVGNQSNTVTPEQIQVLKSLPNAVLYSLLRDLEQDRMDNKVKPKRFSTKECRFCKNNGERESYYRSHCLRDASGRVTCPVLRAFRCKRCGASGDSAHTANYCPLTSEEERIKSAAMMRSVRMASGRRRSYPPPLGVEPSYVLFGEPTPSVVYDNNDYQHYALAGPLKPRWEVLEQKILRY